MHISCFGMMAAHPPLRLRAKPAEAVRALTPPSLMRPSRRRVLHAGPVPISVALLPAHAVHMTCRPWQACLETGR